MVSESVRLGVEYILDLQSLSLYGAHSGEKTGFKD